MRDGRPHHAALVVVTLLVVAAVAACSGDDRPSATPSLSPPLAPSPTPGTAAPSAPRSAVPTPSASILTMTPPAPSSLPALAQAPHQGGGLRIGALRERTASYRSYDVTYRSDDLRISGVLNVPTGPGPFPAVVLAHGYIAPENYVRGQGMTRERGWLAEHGYVALHVDYRNHGESSDDPTSQQDVDLGYATDVINAVAALRKTTGVLIDDQRIAYMGRSMGGAVVMNALVASPGLVQAAVTWSSNSSREAQVFYHFRDAQDPAAQAHGTPSQNPAFWDGVSSRTYFDQIVTPVLIIVGEQDSTNPPRWSHDSYRAMKAAGVDVRLASYPGEEHAFGPQFDAAMTRSAQFFSAHGV